MGLASGEILAPSCFMPMNDKTISRALVTGGNGNLGEAVSRLLLRAGYEVHVTVHDEHTRASFAYGLMKEGLMVHVADLTRPDHCERLAGEIGGPLEALVATVGGFVSGPFAQVDPNAIDQQFALNLKSTMLTLRYAHPLLAASPNGAAVVMVANRPALSSGPNVAVTSAMKAALVHLTRSLCAEWAEARITVNTIAPGIMDTPQNRRDMPDKDPKDWPTPPQVAEVIEFRLSDAGAIVSGAVIPVYGRS
jgi:NAD(P)-dependent dehydrogenase (short-subunit alcohol dehydrogenase family)